MGVYKWKPGARFTADPGKIGDELSSIEILTPEEIVNFAEDDNTELHKCFTWDDYKAAHMYRLEEARSVVQCIVTVEKSETDTVEFRAFESVIISDQRQYAPTKTILQDTDMKTQVFREINDSIGELRRKAKVYNYLAKEELSKADKHLEEAQKAVTV